MEIRIRSSAPTGAALAVAWALLSSTRPAAAQQAPPPLQEEVAQEEPSPSPKLLLRGFGDIDFRREDSDLPGTFTLGQLDLFMTSAITDDVSVLAEIVFEGKEGRDERIIDVERYQIKYAPSDLLNVAIGRMHTVLGHWNQTYHHGTWFQTTVFRPDVYRFEDDDGVLPIHEVGLRLFGTRSVPGLRLEYNASVANGRSPDPREVTTVQDVNGSKALSFWLSAAPKAVPGLKFGGVFHTDRIPRDATRPDRENELDERIWGGFLVYQRAPLELLSEAFDIRHEDRVTHGVFKTTGLYAQGACALGRFKPYYRYDLVDGAAKDPYYPDTLRDASKHTLGVRFDPWARLAVKLEFSHDRPDPGKPFGAAALQVAVTF